MFSESIASFHEGIASKRFSVAEAVSYYLKKISQENGELNAYLEVFDDAQKRAEELDGRLAKGEAPGPLFGLPLAVKDIILIKGRRAGAASKILENYIAPYDAYVIEKLKKESVLFLGRTNMDEFAMGGSTENSAYGVTKNPHDKKRVAGGSSGGSAAVVAADLALASLGSDTGGSVREPASFCGIVGLKPTYGSVSRSGLMAMASSLDQIGPMTKTVADTEILFKAIRGKDEKDGTSREGNYLGGEVKKIGLPYDLLKEGIDSDVLANFEESVKILEKKGFQIKNISLPALKYALAVYYVIMPAEVSSNMARYDGLRYGVQKKGDDLLATYQNSRGAGLGREVRRRVMLGTYVLSAGYYDAYYGRANAVRKIITDDFAKAFFDVDVIAMPVSPTPAFLIGEKAADPLSMYLADVFTVSANLAGIPALSVPAGSVLREGKYLPTGFQILGPHFGEEKLFSLAKILEENYKNTKQ